MFRLFHSLSEIGPEARPSALAVGNFDGVHSGHRKLLQRVVALSRENGWRPSVLTFDPHPTTVVAPGRAPKLLSTPRERWDLMRAEGIEQVFVLRFDLAFASLSPEAFVRDVLVDGCGASGVCVGENFRFGVRQSGDVQALRRLGGELGLYVEVAPSVIVRGRMASSTEIRNLVRDGSVSVACRLLGRPYRIEGSVVSGHGIGARQTVPTLNLATGAEVVPAEGVYITRTTDVDQRRSWPSITNIGTRPTFNGDHQTIETFLLTPLDGPGLSRMELEFLKRVRDERRFDSPSELKEQILRDVKQAQKWFRRSASWAAPNQPV